MPNETRQPSNNDAKDIRVPISGLVDRLLVALVGAIIGGGGAITYTKLEPSARAYPFTAQDGEKLESRIKGIEGKITDINLHAGRIDSAIERLKDKVVGCEEYRTEDQKNMHEMWRALYIHTEGKGKHPPPETQNQIDTNTRAIEGLKRR